MQGERLPVDEDDEVILYPNEFEVMGIRFLLESDSIHGNDDDDVDSWTTWTHTPGTAYLAEIKDAIQEMENKVACVSREMIIMTERLQYLLVALIILFVINLFARLW